MTRLVTDWKGEQVMNKDEALKLAIKALEACKEALEQPAQDYVLICKRCGDDLGIEYIHDEQSLKDKNADNA